jgi:hypothetical protein
MVKLRQALKEREEKFKDQSEKAKEKLKPENKEAFRKVLTMVILNSCVNLMLKIPIVITTMNDLKLLNTLDADTFDLARYPDRRWYQFPYTMKYFCSWDRICEIFESFGNFLYLTSLSLNFLFLRSYDKKFASQIEKKNSSSTNHSTTRNE